MCVVSAGGFVEEECERGTSEKLATCASLFEPLCMCMCCGFVCVPGMEAGMGRGGEREKREKERDTFKRERERERRHPNKAEVLLVGQLRQNRQE